VASFRLLAENPFGLLLSTRARRPGPFSIRDIVLGLLLPKLPPEATAPPQPVCRVLCCVSSFARFLFTCAAAPSIFELCVPFLPDSAPPSACSWFLSRVTPPPPERLSSCVAIFRSLLEAPPPSCWISIVFSVSRALGFAAPQHAAVGDSGLSRSGADGWSLNPSIFALGFVCRRAAPRGGSLSPLV
jgi:hypothetical protein